MKIKVWKNDNWETLSFKNEDQLPGIRNSRTIVPISTVLNYLGFETRWITTGVAGDPSILRAEKGNEKIVIYDGESYFDVTTTYGNEEDCIRYVFPEYAPRTYLLVGGEFMTQIRDVLESVCYTVGWEDKPKTVKITPPTDKQNSVKYNYNYGEKALSGVPYFDITLKGHSVTLPSPTQKGYIFDGWYTAKDGGERVGNGNDEYTPAKSETLYAHWIDKNNHRLSDAFDVGIDDRIFSSISQSEKLDFYRITFEGSGNVEFRLTMPQNANYSLHLLDENAGVLDRSKEKIDRTRSVTFNVQAGVPYNVRIGAVYPSDIVENENYVLEFVPTELIGMSVELNSHTVKPDSDINCEVVLNPSNAYHSITASYNSEKINVGIIDTSVVIKFGSNGISTITFADTIWGKQTDCTVTSIAELTLWDFNKEYVGNDDCIRNSGCAVCCAADIVSFYNKSPIPLTTLRDEYKLYINGDATCYWDRMPLCLKLDTDTSNNYTLSDTSDLNLLAIIHSEIDSGHPVLLHYKSIHNTKYGHWIVAYGYLNNCKRTNDVIICDPSHTKIQSEATPVIKYSKNLPYCNQIYNNGMTLQDCIDIKSISVLTSIHLTCKKESTE